jgi:hypothetical protein
MPSRPAILLPAPMGLHQRERSKTSRMLNTISINPQTARSNQLCREARFVVGESRSIAGERHSAVHLARSAGKQPLGRRSITCVPKASKHYIRSRFPCVANDDYSAIEKARHKADATSLSHKNVVGGKDTIHALLLKESLLSHIAGFNPRTSISGS